MTRFILVLCMLMSISALATWPREADARRPAHLDNQPLTAQRIKRALKVADWMRKKSQQPTRFLPKGVPLLLLSYLLPSMAKVGESKALVAFEKAALAAGYPKATSDMLSLWLRDWDRVMLAYDAKRWGITPASRSGLQKQLSTIPSTLEQATRVRTQKALRYKIRLSQVNPKDKLAVKAQETSLLAFLRRVWR